MPMYNFICEHCGYKFEKYYSYNESIKKYIKCPKCRKNKSRKIVTLSPVVYNGDGFYVTDKDK